MNPSMVSGPNHMCSRGWTGQSSYAMYGFVVPVRDPAGVIFPVPNVLVPHVLSVSYPYRVMVRACSPAPRTKSMYDFQNRWSSEADAEISPVVQFIGIVHGIAE